MKYSRSPAYQPMRTQDDRSHERRGIGRSAVQGPGRRFRGLGRALPAVRSGDFPVLPARALPSPRGRRGRDHGNFHEGATKTRNVRFLAALYCMALQSCEQPLLGHASAAAHPAGSGNRATWRRCRSNIPIRASSNDLQAEHTSKEVRKGLRSFPTARGWRWSCAITRK